MKRTKIFYATDVHGSDVVFRKFVNAGKIYKADILLLGGDLTGKMIVPIVQQPDNTHVAKYDGGTYTAKTSEELEKLEDRISSTGFYPYCTTHGEVEELSSNEKKFNDLFEFLAIDRLKDWIALAEERLRDTGIKIYMTGGNDDIPQISDVITTSDYVINPEEKILTVDGIYEMASTGYGNMTPWKCPRDIPEPELAQIIEKMLTQIERMESAIFNFHVPPYGTPLDLAPLLDENFTPKQDPGGGTKMTNVGSTAVRDAILKHQPLLGLHGHIHESRGKTDLGRTVCFNPGERVYSGSCRLRRQ